tara:strand:+ start:1083 stop:1253 length:171 start_codon:yes stop_codon:yes gene_type:complete
MGFDQFFSILALILILILILPNFIKTNYNNKQFFKNIFIWGIIVALVMIFSVFLFG